MDYLNWSSVCVTFRSRWGDGRWVVHTWVTRDSSPEACLWAGAGGGGLSLLSLQHHMENERPNQTYPIICCLSALCPSGHSISPSARWSQRCSEDGNIRSFCACVTCPKNRIINICRCWLLFSWFSHKHICCMFVPPISLLKRTWQPYMNQGTPTYVILVCNKPPGASDLPLCQCVCCCEWDLVSQTERRAALKLVPTHPGPSPAAPYVCVMSGRLIQPCHQKPYHRWTGFSAPPRCQHGSVPTLKIPWHVFWHLINVSLNAEVVRKTNKLYLAPCQMRLSVLALRKEQKNEFLNVFPTMTELGFCNRVQHMTACCFHVFKSWKHSHLDTASC